MVLKIIGLQIKTSKVFKVHIRVFGSKAIQSTNTDTYLTVIYYINKKQSSD